MIGGGEEGYLVLQWMYNVHYKVHEDEWGKFKKYTEYSSQERIRG